MNEEDLRDCFAMFALLGLVFAHKGEDSESDQADECQTPGAEGENKESVHIS